MKERPILMSAPMVRALLAGTKTQTRRVVKPQPLYARVASDIEFMARTGVRCPYGQPGDRLWVRETFGCCDAVLEERGRPVFYKATDYPTIQAGRWRPSIHMPRWASRITLEITGVRVERLNDISEADAIAEGCEQINIVIDTSAYAGKVAGGGAITARDCYRALWEQINGPGYWDANPWVWVVEFRKAMT